MALVLKLRWLKTHILEYIYQLWGLHCDSNIMMMIIALPHTYIYILYMMLDDYPGVAAGATKTVRCAISGFNWLKRDIVQSRTNGPSKDRRFGFRANQTSEASGTIGMEIPGKTCHASIVTIIYYSII